MEAMRAERRHEVVADMDALVCHCDVSIFLSEKKRSPLFFFYFSIFFVCFFLLRIWLGHLLFRARHDASLAKRKVAIEVLLGAFFVEKDCHLPRRFDKDLTGFVEFGGCQELFLCFFLFGFRDLGEVNARVL
jgi:hypothetical protein